MVGGRLVGREERQQVAWRREREGVRVARGRRDRSPCRLVVDALHSVWGHFRTLPPHFQHQLRPQRQVMNCLFDPFQSTEGGPVNGEGGVGRHRLKR